MAVLWLLHREPHYTCQYISNYLKFIHVSCYFSYPFWFWEVFGDGGLSYITPLSLPRSYFLWYDLYYSGSIAAYSVLIWLDCHRYFVHIASLTFRLVRRFKLLSIYYFVYGLDAVDVIYSIKPPPHLSQNPFTISARWYLQFEIHVSTFHLNSRVFTLYSFCHSLITRSTLKQLIICMSHVEGC